MDLGGSYLRTQEASLGYIVKLSQTNKEIFNPTRFARFSTGKVLFRLP